MPLLHSLRRVVHCLQLEMDAITQLAAMTLTACQERPGFFRRFGLYTQLPQFAKRFGFRFALHMGFDAGRFPIRSEVKRLWESPDASSLESNPM